MGTSLTGLTPSTTYDALIKVGDNGALSATAKVLSDGLGNDSVLALSTTAVGIGTATPSALLTLNGTTPFIRIERAGVPTWQIQNNTIVSNAGFSINNITNATTPLFIDGITNNVGIGTASPQFKLEVTGVVGGYEAGGIALKTYSKIAGFQLSSYQSVNGAPYTKTTDLVANADSGVASELRVLVASSGSNPAEIARFTPNGLTFNGDTAAANALDDYEEGTFTATITPSTSGTITSNASFTTWSYTKIGRQVTINGAFVISSVSLPVGDLVNVGGLPFTVRNSNDAFGAVSAGFADASLSYAKSPLWAVHGTNTTTINLGINASTVAASDEFYITATYFTN